MPDFILFKGATSVILPISVYDSSSTVGAKLAGLTFETANLTAYYNRMGAAGAATAIALKTATKGTWTTEGFVAVDGTNMPGDYELHIPNAALATGADIVAVQLKGAANMVPVNITIQLISATRGMAGTALPDAAADAAGGLIISDAGGLDADDLKADVTAILADTGTDGVVLAADAITSAKIADDAFDTEHFADGVFTDANFPSDWFVS